MPLKLKCGMSIAFIELINPGEEPSVGCAAIKLEAHTFYDAIPCFIHLGMPKHTIERLIQDRSSCLRLEMIPIAVWFTAVGIYRL